MAQPIAWADYDAVLFDLDGVITPTADVHERAWAELFRDYEYTRDDYLASIDGRPRYDGVRTFLASRGITMPEGTPDDPPGDGSVSAMGNKKNELFNEVLAREGIAPYPGSIELLDALDEAGVPYAVVSSSKNARGVLEAVRQAGRFEHVVDGVTAVSEGIPGKPSPEMFVRGASLLNAAPGRSVVVEDAAAGVAAGKAGAFGLVVGVDRTGTNTDALLANGADLVVADLGETLDHDTPGHDTPGHDERGQLEHEGNAP